MGKVFHGIIQRSCKSLDEGAAPGGAGFVELHIVYSAVLDFNTRERYTECEGTTMLSIEEIEALEYSTSMLKCRGCANSCRILLWSS